MQHSVADQLEKAGYTVHTLLRHWTLDGMLSDDSAYHIRQVWVYSMGIQYNTVWAYCTAMSKTLPKQPKGPAQVEE